MNCDQEPSSPTTVGHIGGEDQENKDTSKVPCSSYKYLEKAFEIIFHKIGDLIDKYDVSVEIREHFKVQFIQKFKYLINENITVKGFPWEVYKDMSVATFNKEQKTEYFVHTLLPKIGNEVMNTTAKRKLYPFQYCRILQQRLKLERQNLKRQKVIMPSCMDTNSVEVFDWDSIEKHYEKASWDLNFFNKNIQSQIDSIRKAKENAAVIEEMCCNQDEFAFEETVISKKLLLYKKNRNSPESCAPMSFQLS